MPNAKQEDVDKLENRLSKMETLGNATSRLALQTAHRQGVDSSKRPVVLFLRGALRQSIAEKHTLWTDNAAKPKEERTGPRPTPWREQVGESVVRWILEQLGSDMDEGVQNLLQELKLLPLCVEAVNHGPNQSDKEVWPIVAVFRNSETAQKIRENLLDPRLGPISGRGKDLGVRVARYQPSGPARTVMSELGMDPKGAGKGTRRSPKREAPATSPTAATAASVRVAEGLRVGPINGLPRLPSLCLSNFFLSVHTEGPSSAPLSRGAVPADLSRGAVPLLFLLGPSGFLVFLSSLST